MAMKRRALRGLGSLLLGGGVGLLGGCGDATPTQPIGGAGSSSGASSGGGGGASAGSNGSGAGGGDATSFALVWDKGGFVAADSNPFGIQGPFYFYSDCDNAGGLPCTMPDPALTGPDSKLGWSVEPGKVCAKGTAVKVQDGMFAQQWGAGLALDLNSKGGDPGQPALKGTFNATAANLTGFAVDITGTAMGEVRVNLTMPDLADSNFVGATVPGTTFVPFTGAKQGKWVTMKTPLDPSKLLAIQVQVATSASKATPFDFCITAIRALTDNTIGGGGSGGGGPGGGGSVGGDAGSGGSAGASGSGGTSGSAGTSGNGGASNGGASGSAGTGGGSGATGGGVTGGAGGSGGGGGARP